MILYRNIIQQAWRNTIKNYWLWIFGLFAALLTNVNQYNDLFSSLDGTRGWLVIWRSLVGFWNTFSLFIRSAFSSPALFFVALALVAVAVAAIILAVSSQIALVKQTQSCLKNNKQEIVKTSFWQQLKANKKLFWPTTGLVLTVKLVLLLCLLIASLLMSAIYAIHQPIIGAFLYTLVSLVLLAGIWLIAIWAKYWLLILLSNKKISLLDSAVEAFVALKQNIVASLEMSIIVILINVLAYLAWVFVIYLLAIPFALVGLLLIKYLAFSEIVLAIAVKLFLVVSLILLVGLMTVFETSLWLTFLENLSSKNIISKVRRIFKRN
ncbi:MAG TPA: hypothetical protein PKN62_00035 [bacterium]|nr:hypothetical protein [bacterium]